MQLPSSESVFSEGFRNPYMNLSVASGSEVMPWLEETEERGAIQ
jgi:hypothetical protein